MTTHLMADESPLPNNLEDAIAEILALRSMLIREREAHVKLVEQRELDRRSARGTIKAIQDKLDAAELNSLGTKGEEVMMSTTVLSPEAFDKMVGLINDPPFPNDALVNAFINAHRRDSK